jgi:curved DNA-binding protein CbpA
MLKKPSILLSSYSGFHSLCSPHQHPINTSPPQSTQRPPNRRRRQPQLRRTYAKVHSPSPNNNAHSNDDLQWPDHPTSTTTPTPYQIFQQEKTAPYCKQRFYELVKLYHPDRPHPACSYPLSHATRLERYRLVVAANAILSDPIKRHAYDRYGAGWNGTPDSGFGRHGWANAAAGTGWASYTGPESPAYNATWEDWERWYQRDSNGKGTRAPPQEPLYFSNSAFVSLIVLFAAVGSFGQATRVGELSRTFIEQIEGVHDDCSKDLMRRRKRESYEHWGDGSGNRNRDQRIQSFLKMRDPVGIAGEESHRRLLPAPEVCSSGDTHQT